MGSVSKWSMINVTARLGICGGAVYWTVTHGVWGDQEDALVVFDKVSDAAHTAIKKGEDLTGWKLAEDIQKGRVQTMNAVVSGWNNATQVAFEGLANFPNSAKYYFQLGTSKISSMMNENESTEKQKES